MNGLAGRGQLLRAGDVRRLRLDDLRQLVASLEPANLAPAPDDAEAPPLPARFRLAADGSVVPDVTAGAGEAIGVSPGRVTGRVTHDPASARGNVLASPRSTRRWPPDSRRSSPSSWRPAVRSATSPSSPASNKVPAVVNLAGAVAELHDGDQVLVDGAAGTVEVLDAVDAVDVDDDVLDTAIRQVRQAEEVDA